MPLPSTLKTLIMRAQTKDPSRRREALGTISARYWEPVCEYLRACGNTDAHAMDLTQGFFLDKVLQSDFIDRYDITKNFRPYLLATLNNYVRGRHRHEHTRARYPEGRRIISLEGAEGRAWSEPADTSNPERSFQVKWAAGIVHDALDSVQKGLVEEENLRDWEIFKAKLANPILHGIDAVPDEELCHRHGLSGEKEVKRIVLAVKKRYEQALRRRVREYCGSAREIQREIEDLIRILSDSGAAD
jgi:DNA-directed RNA polymerase specialized sigma24 family protein